LVPLLSGTAGSDECRKGWEFVQTDTAVLLMAHGSRRAEANEDLARLAELVRQQNRYAVVEIGFLELAEPTIQDGGRRCVRPGVRRVLMMPYFLSAGVHVVQDLEEIREHLAQEFPEITFALRPHLGLHPLMAQIVLDRLAEGEPASCPAAQG
jgi:sirohydrochlorin ferrochelatase